MAKNINYHYGSYSHAKDANFYDIDDPIWYQLDIDHYPSNHTKQRLGFTVPLESIDFSGTRFGEPIAGKIQQSLYRLANHSKTCFKEVDMECQYPAYPPGCHQWRCSFFS
jgi:hypothetical protein